MSTLERSLVILKPDTAERKLIGEVISRLESAGMTIVGAKVIDPTDDQINRHYQIDNIDYCTSIGCKSDNIEVVSHAAATHKFGKEKADSLKSMGETVLGWNKNYMKRRPLLIFIFEGNNAISRIRSIIGSTNPPNAAPGTIRFQYGMDSIDLANSEKRGAENMVHASGSVEEARNEIGIWFPEIKAG